ncbi:MAG: Holliday junction resolvase Hjc [Candidatus Woesearchaeota archaeon]
MSRKSKGIDAERELIHMFWERGWAAIRVAGSGSGSYPSPDILAGNPLRKLAIECKTTKGKSIYIAKNEIEALNSFAGIYGSEPWLAARFDKKGWFFMSLDDLVQTSANFCVTKSLASKKGFSISELTQS